MVGEMRRWQFHLAAFVAGVCQGGAPPTTDALQSSELGSGWAPVSRTECMNEASNAPHSLHEGPSRHAGTAAQQEGLSAPQVHQIDGHLLR